MVSKLTFAGLCLCLLLTRCSERPDGAACPVIPLGASIGQTAGQEAGFTLNHLAQTVEMIPIQTVEGCLMAQPRICWAQDSILILEDRAVIYRINSATGQIRTVIDRKGKGPGEYMMIGDVVCDPRRGEIYVSDLARKINTYTLNGRFLSASPVDFIGGFNQLPDRNFAITYYPSSYRTVCVGIYDSTWNKVCDYLPFADVTQQNRTGSVSVEPISRQNEQCYYKSTLGDTLYRLSSRGPVPALVLDKGELRLPAAIAMDVTRKKERSEYIFGEYGFLVDKFYFVSFYYDNRKYYDIWDLNTSALVYRNVLSSPSDPEGVVVAVDQKQINFWPKYVHDDCLYAIVGADTGIVPGLDENSNPVIVKIKIRSSE